MPCALEVAVWFVSYKMLTPTPGRTRTNLSATRKSTLHTSQLRDNFYRTLLSSRTRGARRTTAPRAGFNSFLFSNRDQHAPRACTRRRRALRDAGFSGGCSRCCSASPTAEAMETRHGASRGATANTTKSGAAPTRTVVGANASSDCRCAKGRGKT